MKGDYSRLVGDPALVEFKKRIFDHMHQGLNSIEDAKVVFEKDIALISPVLDRIETEISVLVNEVRTIVVKDAAFLEDEKELTRMFQTIRDIDTDATKSATAGN